ncbi:hypothetical protein [Bacteroides sedimenti]|uniref:hypothetical protein n=1 Tax=Bacteroides sedimenti TaxID=2136147 RepID=UPI00333F5B03
MTRLALTNDFFLKEVIPALSDSDNEPPSREELLNLLFQSRVNQLTGETAGNNLPFLLNRHIPCRAIIHGSAGDFHFT